MKNNFYKLFLGLSIVLFYFLFRQYNIFIYLIVLVLYLLFSNILSIITLNNNKEMFSFSLVLILFLNLVFLFLNLGIGRILSKIFYLSNSIIILFILAFSYLIKPIIGIICEYLRLNSNSKLEKILGYFLYLDMILFIFLSYINLNLFDFDANLSVIITMVLLIVINYMVILFVLRYIYKKFKPSRRINFKVDNDLIFKNISRFLVDNYDLILIYISVVYLLYLLTNRYYYNYAVVSELITNYCLGMFIGVYVLLLFIRKVKLISNNKGIIMLVGISVKLFSSLFLIDIFSSFMGNWIVGDVISNILSCLVVIVLNMIFKYRDRLI